MKYILPAKLVTKEDVRQVGGKGANLGEMLRAGFPVPQAEILTAEAYFDFMEASGLKAKISQLLDQVRDEDIDGLQEASALIRKAFLGATIPPDIESDIKTAYLRLGAGKKTYIAVRSSSTGEDLVEATGAGARITILNAYGPTEVLRAVKEVWASMFTPRSIFYTRTKGRSLLSTGVAVVLQEMIESQVSGIGFSLDPVTNDKATMVIEAVYGLGEMIAQGQVNPDHFDVDKKTLTITYKEVGLQDKELIRAGKTNKLVKVSPAYGASQKISDELISKIAGYVKGLEQHYLRPQDVEWAYDGKNIYIVQTRPITTVSKEIPNSHRPDLPIVLAGSPGAPGLASGQVVVIASAKDLDKVGRGDILVTEFMSPDFVPAMKKAAAIVTDRGGRTAHAAVISRELGLPAVVGASGATKTLIPGRIYTVNGTLGQIYSGAPTRGQNYLPYEPTKISATELTPLKTATKIYVSLADPAAAWEFAKLGPDGAIISPENLISKFEVHPGYARREGLDRALTTRLAEEIASIGQAYKGMNVLYRLSNFTAPQYNGLKGAGEFEVEESNPKLGLRGAHRHLSRPEELTIELEALKRARNVLGAKNIQILLPWVRTPGELAELKKTLTSHGLHRGANFKIYLGADTPLTVLALERFAEIGIDGVVGSEHLLELLLGADFSAKSLEKMPRWDESLELAVNKLGREAKKYGLVAGFNFEKAMPQGEILDCLVEAGYNFISVTPDEISPTRVSVSKLESANSKH